MTTNGDQTSEDLAGQPWAVIESDPAVFTSMMQKLGAFGLQAKEIVSLDLLDPASRGFIFCFKWQDSYEPDDYDNDEEEVAVPWFANQVNDDSCATLAILNTLLNLEDVDIGPTLSAFKEYTTDMESSMRGLCLASSSTFRRVHNSFARPIDIRASTSKIANVTLHPPKATKGKGKKITTKAKSTTETPVESFHFLSYIPYQGRVWELDGLKKAPLECAEIEGFWIDAVLPALRSRMESFSKNGDIRFSLIALVPCEYQSRVDDFELAKRKIAVIERRLQQELGDGWNSQVSSDLLHLKAELLSNTSRPRLGIGFGARSNEAAMQLLNLESSSLVMAWQDAVRSLRPLQMAVEEELKHSMQSETDHIKRTHDYDPFIREYVTRLYNAGFLQDLLDVDGNGRPRQKNKGKKR